jgi:hypothetical protein
VRSGNAFPRRRRRRAPRFACWVETAGGVSVLVRGNPATSAPGRRALEELLGAIVANGRRTLSPVDSDADGPAA